MPNLSKIENDIFLIENDNDFNELALEIFYYQAENNNVYKSFIKHLGINISAITSFRQIPFLPVEFFKTHKIVSGRFAPQVVFTSSGTTGSAVSRHHVKNQELYAKSFFKGFEYFFGNITEYVILALLPSYLEREGSSLVYMADKLIRGTRDERSGFYLHDYDKLSETLMKLKFSEKRVLLLGVTYALLDMAERFNVPFPELTVMETGGMKGKRKEMVREELHNKLIQAFGIKKVFSEYGMTELLSQAYSKGEGIFYTPPWMKILVRDINDPLTLLPAGKSGGINIIDLANIHSCSFIAVQDLGKVHVDGGFEILGRFDNSDIRGCNLMIQ